MGQLGDDTGNVPEEPGRRSGRGAASVSSHLASDEKRRIPAAREPLTSVREQYTILVVDDSRAARYPVARNLRAAGFRTREASTGAQALALAAGVSAVVLDVHLPDIHGLEVCRLLRANRATASLPIVHVSAVYLSEEDGARGLGAGADA